MYRTLLALSTLVAVLCIAPAAQAAGWATTEPLSPANRIATQPQVALTPGGERIVAWLDSTPNGATQNVSVRTAPPGGDFGPAQTFDGAFEDLHLAAGSDGTVALAWVDFRAHAIHVARRAPGQSTFTQATPVVPTTTENLGGLDLAVSRGDAYVSSSSFTGFLTTTSSSVWLARLPAGGSVVQLVPGTGAGGTVDHVSFVPPAAAVFVQLPTLAVDDGRVTVAWDQDIPATGDGKGVTTVKLARGGAGGVGAPAPITTVAGTSTSSPGASPAVASGGAHTYVVWHALDRVAFVDVANLGSILQIPADTRFEGGLRAGVDSSGSLVAAWEAAPPDRNTLVTGVVVPPSAAPPTAVHLSPVGPERRLDDLAVADDGAALVLPDHSTSGFDTNLQVDGVLRPAGGAFGPAEDISGPQDAPRNQFHQAAAAVAPGGRAVAVWAAADHSGTINQRLRLSERDTAPPVLGTIAGPATATVGEPAGFAATAGDILSGTTISWDFGDGSQADGGVVSHTFGTPGPAIVTITATDDAGNSTSEQRVVAVEPAPRAGGGGDEGVDRTAPAVTRVSLTHRRFRVGRSGTAQLAAKRSKRAPAGTALRLNLSERATLAVAFERRKIVRGTIVRAAAGPGRVTIPFSGRIGRTALPAGSYTATVTAIDGAGNRSKRVRVKFTVARR